MKNRFLSAAAACLPLTAVAGDFMEDVKPTSEVGEWRFRLTPYAWAAGVSGDFAQFGLPLVEVNNSFSEVLENLDVGAMAAFEAWRGRYGLLADLVYVRLSGSGTVSGFLPVAVPVSASATSTTGMLAAQYRWLDGETGHLDVLGGLRHWSLTTRLNAGTPVNVALSESVRWNDPVIGVKGLRWLSENTYLTGWAMLGGLAGGAEPVIDLMAGVGYKINDSTALILAYRHVSVDYREGAFLYDSVQQGFGLGLDLRF